MIKIKKIKNARMPNLDTLMMIYNTLSNNSFSQRELWLKLPKKVMWQTFIIAIYYLIETNQINLESGKISISKINKSQFSSEQNIQSNSQFHTLSNVPNYVY